MLNIVQLGNKGLRSKSPKVTHITDELISNTKKMSMLLRLADGYGLAAPQVGIAQSYFVYNVGDGFKTIINPEIVEHSDSVVTMEEGCLSIKGFFFPIIRPEKVTLRGLDLKDNLVELEVDGLLARLFQHEVDHCNGKLVIDHLEPDEKERFMTKWNKLKRR